jgi:uncharacterized protein (TIGR00730 family)
VPDDPSNTIDRRGPPTAADKRREPLPWQAPKSAQDDADAPARIRALLDSPTYRQADRDADFLNTDATRGVRLQIDYLKAELHLAEYGVKHTIVVFGSTRILEPAAARRNLAALADLAAVDAGNSEARRRAEVAERILDKSRYYDIARELGRIVGGSGAGPDDCSITLMTGGGPGIMEAANRGAHDVGAKSIGLNIALPAEQFPNPYVTPELCFRFHYFSTRKLHFLLRARALVAFPGGYGTLDEVFETLTLVQSRTIDLVPVILVGKDYWRRVFDVDFLLAEGAIEIEDRALFSYAETAEEIWQVILKWHEANGTPLLRAGGKQKYP